MTSKEYTELAMRTESPADPLAHHTRSRILHSALGCSDESGELVKRIKDKLFYNKSPDTIGMLEEYGDLLWFIAIGVDALGATLEEVMETNINKLRARYPEKFTKDKAVNRDLDAERESLEQLFWKGVKITNCDLCQRRIEGRFVDGSTAEGPASWAIMCPGCHTRSGQGFGLGKGQMYELLAGRYVKING